LSAASAAPGPAATPPLRTVFCTRGGAYGALVLERLGACPGIELCAIVRSGRILDAHFGWLRGALALIRRCGLAYALYLWCVTSLADWRGASKAAAPAGIPSLPVHTTRDLNSAAGLGFLARCAPDLLLSACFDQRLGEAALAIPTRGCVNIHPALLPEFRGVDPVLQARLAGAGSLGVTVHWMTPRLDAGAILAQQAVALPARGSVFAATAALFAAGAELLAASLERIARRDPGVPQRSGGSYQSWPSRAEVRALRALGIPLIGIAELSSLLRSGGRAALPPAPPPAQ
jgi:methionyl-tRNA formyltransferase